MSLQKCLSVCSHYESLHLHIQHIRSDKLIDYLKKCHQSKKRSSTQSSNNTIQDKSENQRQRSQSCSHSSQNTQGKLSHSQCFGCGHDKHANRSDCPAMGKVCHKCGCENHFESVCGRIPYFRRRSKSHGRKQVNELKQDPTVSANSAKSVSDNSSKTVPKQEVDIIDIINHGQSSGENLRRTLELDTLSATSRTMPQAASQTQIFSNIDMNGVLIRGKQDTGAKVNAMPLNVYDQLNQKLNGKLELRPCDKIRVIGYSKQLVEIVGKVSMICTHATTIKKVNFYITNLVNTKVILGLQFCRVFNLVTVNCNEHCVCKEVAAEALNAEFPRGFDPSNTMQNVRPPPPPVDINIKLRQDCKAHILELFPELFVMVLVL